MIVVVETKNLSGSVYGTVADWKWRRSSRRGRSHAFLNPIRQNAIHLDAVRRIVGRDVDVRGIVVMAGTARFPKGMPDGVVALDGLAAWARQTLVHGGRAGLGLSAWEVISSVADATDRREAVRDHRATIDRATGRRTASRRAPKERIDPTF